MTNEIGPLLRRARIAQSLSLRSVAAAIGLSPSLVSQVETGKTQPSVATLYSLTSFLGLSIDDLLAQPHDERTGEPDSVQRSDSTIGQWPTVQHCENNPTLEMENGVKWERLAVGPEVLAEPLLVTYSPGASSSVEGKLMRHSGYEYAYILEGHLTLQLEFESYELGAGDSLQFDSIRPHMYFNHGATNARGLWFVVGRQQQSQSPADDPRQTSAVTGKIYELNSAIDVMNALSHST